jgi:hypothetical protein
MQRIFRIELKLNEYLELLTNGSKDLCYISHLEGLPRAMDVS